MNIPKTIRIYESTWQIEYRWNLQENGHKCDGICDYSFKTILIDRTLSKEEKILTFLHELNHAIIDEIQIKRKDLKLHIEEKIVEAIAQSYLTIFKIRMKR